MIIHRLWLGPRPIPEVYEDYWRRWGDLHPEAELRTWREDNLPPLRNQSIYEACGVKWGVNVRAEKPQAAIWVQRADIVAYELIEQFGGVYLNCDVEPLRSLDDLVRDVPAWAGWELQAGGMHRTGLIGNAIFGAAEPGHPFWSACIDAIPQRVPSRKPIPGQTGPALVTELYYSRPGELTVFPASHFMPVHWSRMELRFTPHPQSYTVHHWGHRVPDEELWSAEVLDDPTQSLILAGDNGNN